MHDKLNGQHIKLENAKRTLGENFLIKLMQIEPAVMLDHSFLVILNVAD